METSSFLPLIVPDSVHTKTRLRYPDPRNSSKKLVLPPVDLQPALLIVGNSDPLIAPVARRNGIAVAPARRRGIQTDLLLDGPAVAQPERGDVALQVEAVGARRGEQVPPRHGERAHVAAVHGVVLGDPRRYQRERVVRVHGHVRLGVDDVLAEPVPGLHQGVQVVARRVHGDPAGVVLRGRGVHGPHEAHLARGFLLVHPELVGFQVGRVEPGLGRVEDHAVYTGVWLVLIVLGVLGERAGLRNREHRAVSRVRIEWVAVDGIWRLFRCEEKDGTCVRVGGCGLSYCDEKGSATRVGSLEAGIDDIRPEGEENVRWWSIGWEASWTISVGLFTEKLDHFFMAAPYMFFLACWNACSVREAQAAAVTQGSNVGDDLPRMSSTKSAHLWESLSVLPVRTSASHRRMPQ
jgi:hypothetical protein